MMRERLFWIFAALLSLALALGVSTACTSSDDDDDDDDTAGDSGDDDDDDDDDDAADDDAADDDAADDDAADDDAADDDVADDDATDDDSGDSCEEVVTLVWNYCPDWDYDALYEAVCVTYQDPECLQYCYDAYDACEDILNCYNNDGCLD